MRIDHNEIEIRELKAEEISIYVDFQNRVKMSMQNPEWLGDISEKIYIDLLRSGSKIYLWIYQNKIIASGMLIPATKKDLENFFSSDLNSKKVIDFGPQMVDPEYIGNGLQNVIIKYLESVALELGFKYGITTIHPDNIFSIRNFSKNSFKEIGEVSLKRGNRKVYRKIL